MADLLFIVGFYLALAAGLLTPILILVKAIETYRLVNIDPNVYIFKSIVAMSVWLVLSLGMSFMMFVYVFASAHRDRNATPNWTGVIVFVSLTLMYSLFGWGLVRWMMRRK
jgi:hypothetical protein